MPQSERLQKALRRFHFRQSEAQIRRELSDLIGVLPDAIRFVDWDHHDLIAEQIKLHRVEAGEGRYPTGEIEWSVDERDTVQETIMSLADKIGNKTAYLYIPQYILSFVPYKGWKLCEVPMIRMEMARNTLENALDIVDHVGYLEIILSEGEEMISIDKIIEHGSGTDHPVQRVIYRIIGLGSAVVDWLSCRQTT